MTQKATARIRPSEYNPIRDLAHEIWPRLVEAARHPRLQSATYSDMLKVRVGGYGRSVGSRALNMKLDLHYEVRSRVSDMCKVLGMSPIQLGTTDSGTAIGLRILERERENLPADLRADLDIWAAVFVRSGQMTTSPVGVKPERATEHTLYTPPNVRSCPVCAGTLVLQGHALQSADPHLECELCKATFRLGDALPAGLPSPSAARFVTIAEAAVLLSIPRSSLAARVKAAGVPAVAKVRGSKSQLYRLLDVEIAASGRWLVVQTAATEMAF